MDKRKTLAVITLVAIVVAVTLAVVFTRGSNQQEQTENAVKIAPLEWWQQSVIYQIYPRSFQDSDGDGVGDINGITSRLDYLVDLGIDAVWISPFYKSPMKDFGYDISDFKDIDPIFGTLEDFKRMSTEFKRRGIKLIMDVVPNHSSDEHEWFNKSVNKIEPYTDYYVWQNASGYDSEGQPIVPNNWVSAFTGPAWKWNEQRQQFYLHQFVKEQPDLNFENIRVRNEVLAVIKFWLDMGVDGFRVDAVPFIYEDQRFLDEPVNPNRDPNSKPDEYKYYLHPYSYNQPRTLEFLADMRRLLDVYSMADGNVRCMMVESGVPDDEVKEYYGTEESPVAHFPFNFHLLDVNTKMNASAILSLINVWYDIIPADAWATFLLGNHDQKRFPTRWSDGSVDGANMINLLLKGTAVTYYGEEIGMTDTFLTWEQTVDPAACNTDPERYEGFSRDPARTPMQWTNGTGAGFSSSSNTWLPLNDNYKSLNVEAQLKTKESHIKVYHELLKLRNTDTWRYGSYESRSLSSDRVLGFTRISSEGNSGKSLLVLVNLSDDNVSIDATTFNNVPSTGSVKVRSVDFKNQNVVVGGNISTTNIPLGSRDSVVIEFDRNCINKCYAFPENQ